ncbi:MAG: hypothetical protein ACJAZN_000997, partial [Planctomycetota bacterium]
TSKTLAARESLFFISNSRPGTHRASDLDSPPCMEVLTSESVKIFIRSKETRRYSTICQELVGHRWIRAACYADSAMRDRILDPVRFRTAWGRC